MDITLEVVSKVINHLKPNDRLSIIALNHDTSIIQNMTKLNLKTELFKISANGCTKMSAALDCCASLFDTNEITNNQEYDN